mgnify:CR=1 FL=1
MEIIECKGVDALQRLEELRREYLTTGNYPFIIGDQEKLRQLQDVAEFNETKPQTALAEALKINVPQWFQARLKEEREYGDFDESELLGEWPTEQFAPSHIVSHLGLLTGQELPLVYLGLMRLEKSWQLPAFAKFGSWNACPDPELHCALLGYWNEKYGAEIVCLSRDTIECKVSRPPSHTESALALAWEQYWYCSDIVMQGVGTVSNLAATLLNADYWYFWWD